MRIEQKPVLVSLDNLKAGCTLPAKSSLSGELSLLLLLSWCEELLAREISILGVEGVWRLTPPALGDLRDTSSLIPGRILVTDCFSSGLSRSSLRSSNEAKGAGPIRRCLWPLHFDFGAVETISYQAYHGIIQSCK